EGAEDCDILSRGAIARLHKTKPAPLMHADFAERIQPGNLEDHLERVAKADWIVEAVVEDLKIKQKVFKQLEKVRKGGSFISSNTSTIPRAQLTKGMGQRFERDFLITHFFNPPRYLRLLEIVPSPVMELERLNTFRDFTDRRLGKGVVICNDTPGFIGNRIGVYWMQCAINAAIELGLTVEEADAVMGRPIGVPKTAVFGLLDLVGLDLVPHIAESMLATLPENDDYRRVVAEAEENGIAAIIAGMIEAGYTGRKGKGGFYRLNRDGGKKVKEARDLTTGDYAPANRRVALESPKAAKQGLRALVEYPDKGGEYAWKVLSQTLAYTASLIPEIAGSISDVDEAMRLGYGWKRGPFEMLDTLGVEWFCERLTADGLAVPPLLAHGSLLYEHKTQLMVDGSYIAVPRAEDTLHVTDLRKTGEPLASNASASIWDAGDGIALLEFHSKMNSIDPLTLEMVAEAVELVEMGDFVGLVIGNDGEHFSAGANIGLALFVANVGAWEESDKMIRGGQLAFMTLKHSSFPVVGASSGLAIGGGCEVLLACDAIQAHAETYTGLVEVGVGLVPAWGGCKEMLRRWTEAGPHGPMAPVTRIFENVGTAKVATSAFEARDMQILREGDGITMNRERVLADAKARCLEMVASYEPPEIATHRLAGPSGRAGLQMAVADLLRSGKATPHDEVVAGELAIVLTGGETDPTKELDDSDILDLEREAILKLMKTTPTLERIEHMLNTGKPLRN
ncbi:MAG: 3-hydroxyacyl-CoA dehydrogenase NAD-binding domain-containing protein, partial [Candidatus Poseidoniia archaeon]|nr:3-hydroxyacyl-CoA dehydrogenase NAD-binding domain-containing protein [Candidatus Poseidoniia archaeon]